MKRLLIIAIVVLVVQQAMSENPNCDFGNPQKQVDGGYSGITKEECVAKGNCFDDTTPDTIWCFRENKGKSRNPACDFSNPEKRINGGWPQISKSECESMGYCFDDTIPDVVWCFRSNEKLASSHCDFGNPQKRVDGGYSGITKEECVAEGNCFDDTTPDTIWCFRENKGKSRNPACDFSNPEKRINGGWPQISKSECESMGYCFDDTIPDVVWCFRSNEKLASSHCDFGNPQKRVDGGYSGITKEECVAEGNCFDDTTPDTIWCFRENKGKSRNPACDFSNPEKRINGGWPQISKSECESMGYCFDDTIPDVVWSFRSNEKLASSHCDFGNPQKRVDGGYSGITKEECVAEGNCFDDTTPDTIWCFRENKGKSRNPACDFSNPEKRINGGWPQISKSECESMGYCFDDTIPDVVWCFRSNENLASSHCDFGNPQKRVDGGYSGITKEECVAEGNCFDDTTPDTIWCFRENKGKSRNPACDFSNPEKRINGGWPQISKSECESMGYCFDDTIPDVVWCFRSNEKLASSHCDFGNPQKRVDGGYSGITKEECVAEGNCFDDTTPDTIWCFRENKGKSRNPACDFSNPEKRINGGWPQISKSECESMGYCFDDTIPDVVWCFRSNEKLASSHCDFGNPQKRVDGGYSGITKEECVAEGNCFDDTTPDTIWCFRENKGKSRNPACDFSNPEKRINGGWPQISKSECESMGYCFDDTIPDVVWSFRSNEKLASSHCDFGNPQKRVDGGYSGITKEECVAEGNCFDDTTPDTIWCFRENKGKSRNPACDFSNPEKRINGGWPQISKSECESMGYCFDDTIPDVVWCFRSNEKLASSHCDFGNPQKRVDGGYSGITKEECVAKGHCFDDTALDTVWCFRGNKGTSRNPACDISNPKEPCPICPLHEVYNEYGSACPLTCDNYEDPPELCIAGCIAGCECEPGYVRNTALGSDGTCCLKSKCPARVSGYSSCTPKPCDRQAKKTGWLMLRIERIHHIQST